MQISLQILNFILQNFVLFFWDFNGSSSKKKYLQMLVMKSGESLMENVRGSDQF